VFKSQFVKYDYSHPQRIPAEMMSSFDFICADPPFLSEECWLKTAETVRCLAKKIEKMVKDNTENQSPANEEDSHSTRILVCTGLVMKSLVERELGVQEVVGWRPQHANGLANEFSAFCNFSFK
jgi:hypothetical protein